MNISKNKVTLKTIAKELDISISTASRAFTAPDSVKPSTLSKIKEFSRKHNYMPNLNARALVQQKTHIIGVILQSLRNQPTDSLVKRLTRLLSEKGYDIHIFVAYNDPQLNSNAVQSCICRGYDGIIINSSTFEGKMDAIEELIEEKIPFVVLGQYNYSAVSQVIGDFKLSGMVMTKHLIELGHKNIAFLTNTKDDPRYEGYRSMLSQNSIPPREEMLFTCPCEQEPIDRTVREILKTDATAIFANFDEMSLRTIRTLKEMDISVPDDISVVSVGDEMYADLVKPALTTFEINNDHLAENLVETLFERIEKPESPTRTILLNGNIIIRESCQEIRKECLLKA